MSDPELLPNDMWICIWSKLPTKDRIRLRAASKFWMSILPRQPPWLVIVEYLGNDRKPSSGVELDDAIPPPPYLPRCGLLSLGDQPLHPFNFEQIHHSNCIGSQGDWLILSQLRRIFGNRMQTIISLVNPFIPWQIFLPFPSRESEHCRRKVVFSSSPSNGKDCIIMSTENSLQPGLAFTRIGDPNWTSFDIVDAPSLTFIDDLVFYEGHFYVINNLGVLMVCIWQFHFGDGQFHRHSALILAPGFEDNNYPFGRYRKCYLVEWIGELLLVVKWIQADNNMPLRRFTTSSFEVYKFDFTRRKWIELNSLGEHSLFLGFNTSVSVCAAEYFGATVRKNCIYFTDDLITSYIAEKVGGYEIGLFDLDNRSVTRCFSGISTCVYAPPVWMVPSSATPRR